MLKVQGIEFQSLTEEFDTTTPGGKLKFHVFGELAELGVTATRARGRVGGRPKKLADPKKLALAQQLYADNSNDIQTICETLVISRATL